jgi:tetratricopeptide (TPR) repeat protein
MPRTRTVLSAAALLALTAAAYLPLWGNGFIDFDDDHYIIDNPHVTGGLTAGNFAWAWTSLHGTYWQPLSWLSLQADAQFSPAGPAGEAEPSAAVFHGQSLGWHAASTLLLFGLFWRLTGAWGRSFLVAALFAIHPLHVESVAWAAERKDVLSAFFGLLALWAYARYAAAPGAARYALVAAAYALSLLAKPMLMTLPVTLLLLDYWPLGRLRFGAAAGAVSWRRLLWEKVPLFLLAAGSAVITAVARARSDSLVSLERLPLSDRLATAATGYGWYLAHTAWPRGLAVLYPHPKGNWHVLPVLAGVAVLLGGTLLALGQGRRRPWLLVGWLWFVGALVPVIGLAQGGTQAWADRFSYWPHVGLFVVVVWGLGELAGRLRVPAAVTAIAAALALAALAVLTREQVGYWQDTETVWAHDLAAAGDNSLAHEHLTAYYLKTGRPDRAVEQAAHAVCLRPDAPALNYSLGVALMALGRDDEADRALVEAVRHAPDSADAWHNLGVARLRQGRPEQAAHSLSRALALAPDSADTEASLGLALWRSGRREEGLRALQAALQLDPDSADAWRSLGVARLAQGRPAEAAEALARSLRLQPELIGAYSELGLAFGRLGRWDQAAACHGRAVAMVNEVEEQLRELHGRVPAPDTIPQPVLFRCRLGFALDHLGERTSADAAYRDALRCDRSWPQQLRARARQLADDPEEGRRDPFLAAELSAQAERGAELAAAE